MTNSIDPSTLTHPNFKLTSLGWIPEEWEVVKLDDVAKRGTRHTPDKEYANYYNGGIKWISLADSYQLDKLYISKTKVEISADGIRKSSAVLHPQGTVVLSRDAGVGKSSIMAENMAVSQHFVTWTCGPDLDNIFLFYKLQELKPLFERIAVGSTIKTIRLPFFRKLAILLPPLSEQLKIATVLGAWDAAIEKTGQLLTALRQRHRALQQQLLTGQTRFPEFQGEAWREVKLGDMFERVQRKNTNNSFYEVMTISAKHGFMSQSEKFNRVIAGRNINQYTLLHKGEFSYNKGNSDLYPYGCIYRLDSYIKALVPNVYISFRPIGEIDSDFFSHYFKFGSLNSQLPLIINSGVRNDGLLNINTDGFWELKLKFPSLAEQHRIAEVLDTSESEIRQVTGQLAVLQNQKRALMQQLLTGRLRVKTEATLVG